MGHSIVFDRDTDVKMPYPMTLHPDHGLNCVTLQMQNKYRKEKHVTPIYQ